MTDTFELYGQGVTSRLLVGTALYPSPRIMMDAVNASAAEIVTVSLRRQSPESGGGDGFWRHITELGRTLLPNTAGCHSVAEAVRTAKLSRELFETNWLKLEVIGDDYNLQPDPVATIEAAEQLLALGFEVFPYCTDDLVVCQRLRDVGCRVLMPWGSPIGTGRGLMNPYNLQTIRERIPELPLIVDAGIGKPSHAAQALELGYDAVLLNTAIARATDPVRMAEAFRDAVSAGRTAWLSGVMPESQTASPSTPTLGMPFWHHGG